MKAVYVRPWDFTIVAICRICTAAGNSAWNAVPYLYGAGIQKVNGGVEPIRQKLNFHVEVSVEKSLKMMKN